MVLEMVMVHSSMLININNYQVKRIHLEHSIHEMANIIMPRFLLEVALRAAFMKDGNDKLSEKINVC